MAFKILSGAVLIIIVLVIMNFIRNIISRPTYSSVEKRIKYRWSDVMKARIEKWVYSIKNRVYKSLSRVIVLSKAQEREYIRYVERLDLKWGNEPLDPRIIKINQIFFALLWAFVALCSLTFSPIIGILLFVTVPVGYRFPVIEMKDKMEKIDAIISREFYSFYSVIYYQFRKQNKMLSSVVKDYLPNASEEMAFELKIFLNNLTKGEEYALVQLRKRLPLKHIIRFCDIMKVRVVGIENISQMMYLKEEMHEEERQRIIRALEKRKRQAKALQVVVYIILAQFVIVYWYLQLNYVGNVLNG